VGYAQRQTIALAPAAITNSVFLVSGMIVSRSAPAPGRFSVSIWVRIPIYSGRVFRREAGHRSDLKPSTIPK
jgi:hypothetical protein